MNRFLGFVALATAVTLWPDHARAETRGGCLTVVGFRLGDGDHVIYRVRTMLEGVEPSELDVTTTAAVAGPIFCSDDGKAAVLMSGNSATLSFVAVLGLAPLEVRWATGAEDVSVDVAGGAVYFKDQPSHCPSAIGLRDSTILRLCDASSDTLAAALATNDLKSQALVLGLILRDESLRHTEAFQSALPRLLATAVSYDRDAAPREQQQPQGVRQASPWRTLYGALLVVASQSDNRSLLAMLAQADHERASSGLVAFGSAAIGAIASALSAPMPRGYSADYKARLVSALQRIANSPLGEKSEEEIARIAAARLAQSADPRELLALIHLVDSVDDTSAVEQLETFVRTPEVLAQRGIADSQALSLLRTEAARILSRRLALR